MNRKQKIIVSITGIFIVLLALIGLTYAYFLTQITGNGNPKSISVTTADLRLVYDDLDDQYVIGEGELIEPDTIFETKTFTVTNTGNEIIDAYAVVLENVRITDATTGKATTLGVSGQRKIDGKDNDFDLVITCKDQNGNDCNGYDGVLPEESKILVTNSINPKDVHTYSATLTYLETNDNQSSDMNKNITGKFNIIDTKDTADIEGTVTNTNGELYYVQTNSTKRISGIDSTGKYKVMGLEAGTHTIKLCERHATLSDEEDNCSKPVLTREIKIKTGDTPSGNDASNTITIKKGYRIANIEIDASSKTTTIGESVLYTIPYKEGTLSYTILSNALNATGTSTIFSEPLSEIGSSNLENERVLAETIDDEGPSYYFRGNVIDNYVTFANMCWRIVRTEGDGAVKLILEDVNEPCSSTMDGNWEAGNGTYGMKGYENDAFPDYQNSIKKSLEKWFESNQTLLSVQEKVKDDTWCISNFKYDRNGNLIDEGTTSAQFIISNPDRTLRCFASGEVEGETDTYKLGGLTYDEVRFAGISSGDNNYLINDWYRNNSDYWTSFTLITPIWYDDYAGWSNNYGQAGFYAITNYNGDLNYEFFEYYMPDEPYGHSLRPVLSLTKNQSATTKPVDTNGAPGTIGNPYIIN